MLSRLSLVMFVTFAGLTAYWLLVSRPPGLPLPRQLVLSLGFGSAFFLYGCEVERRRGRLQDDGRINHGFVTELIVTCLSLGTVMFAVVLPTLYLLAAYAIEGALISAPELDARLPAGYSGSYIVGLAALGGIVTTSYTVYSYLDHVNRG